MATPIPAHVSKSITDDLMTYAGLTLTHQGKVRNTYTPEKPAEGQEDLLFVLATDRVSIFDFVLPALLSQKGEILTALTVFWLKTLLRDAPHHLVACGKEVDAYLPDRIHATPNIQSRLLIVKKLHILPVECVVRGYLTGSSWRSYQESQSACGCLLPPGLHDGSKLPEPLFTPTTKAHEGHDEDINRDACREQFGIWPEQKSVIFYNKLARYCEARGVILADIKFEFGCDGTLADEVATPDSSRFWSLDEWKQVCERRQAPSAFDKEIVRTWGKSIETPFDAKKPGILGLDPLNPDHINFVRQLAVPPEVLEQTRERYHQIFKMITGFTLKEYQQRIMKVDHF